MPAHMGLVDLGPRLFVGSGSWWRQIMHTQVSFGFPPGRGCDQAADPFIPPRRLHLCLALGNQEPHLSVHPHLLPGCEHARCQISTAANILAYRHPSILLRTRVRHLLWSTASKALRSTPELVPSASASLVPYPFYFFSGRVRTWAWLALWLRTMSRSLYPTLPSPERPTPRYFV